MNTIPFHTSHWKVILMAALGMMFGWFLINVEGQYTRIIDSSLQPWEDVLFYMLLYSLPSVSCGLLLGIVAGVNRRAFLRIVFWSLAGGMLSHLATLPVRMVNTAILARTSALPVRDYNFFFILCLVSIMCIYGLFHGVGLGLAFGGWKSGLKFALIGMVANAIGILAGYLISSGVGFSAAYWVSSDVFGKTPLIINVPSSITWIIMGLLAGGILGWFFGRVSKHRAVRGMEESLHNRGGVF